MGVEVAVDAGAAEAEGEGEAEAGLVIGKVWTNEGGGGGTEARGPNRL